jgi:medium-chain acyl-[acyl-carrier-protein] hydrolase
MGSTPVARWLTGLPIAPATRVHLLCCPPAGAAASIFHGWSRVLLSSIAISALKLPGREARFSEAPYRRLDDLVRDLAAAVAEHLTPRVALFGHSMGAAVAFELARELRRIGATPPKMLFVSGRRGPALPARVPNVYRAPESELIEKLRALGGTPDEVLSQPDLMKAILPTIRADFEAHETYVYRPGEKLTCPISAFCGLEDPVAPIEDVRAWRDETTGRFRARALPGGHFFLQSARDRLLSAITEDLGPFLQ